MSSIGEHYGIKNVSDLFSLMIFLDDVSILMGWVLLVNPWFSMITNTEYPVLLAFQTWEKSVYNICPLIIKKNKKTNLRSSDLKNTLC